MVEALVHEVPAMFRAGAVCRLPAVIVVCQVLFGCTPAPVEKIDGGSQVARDDWSFSAGTIFLQHDVPGLLLGTRKSSDGPREIAYVMLFRHEVSANTHVQRPEDVGVTFDGKLVSMKDGITIDGKTVSLRLQIEVKPHSPQVKSETLKLDNQVQPTAQGRLFLVDLTVNPPTWQQVRAQLPTDLPDPSGRDAVREVARIIMTDLSRNNATVAQFLTKRK